DTAEFSHWRRFAAKGGIRKCTATHDCVAEVNEDLKTFLTTLQDNVITVLMQIPNTVSPVCPGYYECVVGRFQTGHVHSHSEPK
ncbi:hypothetical protein K435DRAFT_649808, partial [Dendrothele bispora CBS 962.96]